MKKVFGLFVLMFTLIFSAGFSSASEYGVYVAPKFMYTIQNITGLGYNPLDQDEYKVDHGVGAALAVGYDWWTKYELPIRTEIEYAIRQDANVDLEVPCCKGKIENTQIAHSPQSLFVNAYLDFHNSSPVTPYIGAGIGLGIINANTNLAWNIGGGVAWEFAKDWKLDVSYRFVDLGEFEDWHATGYYTAHEVMAGLRYTF